MPEDPKRIAFLIAGFIRGALSDAEHGELDEWITRSDENATLFAELTDEKNIRDNLQRIEAVNTRKAWREMQQRLGIQPARSTRGWWLAAAGVLVLVATFAVYQFSRSKTPIAQQAVNNATPDIPAGGNKARLTLGDGSVIDLVNARDGKLQAGAGAEVVKTREGQLAYAPINDSASAIAFHTLSTPRGGRYQVTLPDGTRAWLNAASSLKYPVRFAEKQRHVELTGEAFFEVSKDATRPFIVQLPGDHQVEVTGTQFNAMSYAEEGPQTITLVEGRVQVHAEGKTVRLVPGMQARIGTGNIQTMANAAIEEITAWKNDTFLFSDTPIEAVMRQVERWYDVKVVYQGHPTVHLYGSFSRELSLSKLLHYLELTQSIHFKIENNTITVMN